MTDIDLDAPPAEETIECWAAWIEEYILKYDWVTFAELHRRLGPAAKGSIEIGNFAANVIFWQQLSDLFVDALDRLFQGGRVAYAVAQFLSYVIDGATLRLPTPKRMPRDGRFKAPHWLPLCLRHTETVRRERTPKGRRLGKYRTLKTDSRGREYQREGQDP